MDYIKNIDTFIEKFNLLNEYKIERKSFFAEENENEISYYCMLPDNILIHITSDAVSMNIKSISLTAQKNSKNFETVSANVLSAISDSDKNTSEKHIKDIMKDKEKEYANEMHTLQYISLNFVKTNSGQKLTVSYNEELPTETTSMPETAKEYHFKG